MPRPNPNGKACIEGVDVGTTWQALSTTEVEDVNHLNLKQHSELILKKKRSMVGEEDNSV